MIEHKFSDRLKKYLPKGAIKAVAQKHGVTVQTVSTVANGKTTNFEILESLLEYAEQSKKVEERVKAL